MTESIIQISACKLKRDAKYFLEPMESPVDTYLPTHGHLDVRDLPQICKLILRTTLSAIMKSSLDIEARKFDWFSWETQHSDLYIKYSHMVFIYENQCDTLKPHSQHRANMGHHIDISMNSIAEEWSGRCTMNFNLWPLDCQVLNHDSTNELSDGSSKDSSSTYAPFSVLYILEETSRKLSMDHQINNCNKQMISYMKIHPRKKLYTTS